LGLGSIEEISLSEFDGFLKAELLFTEKLSGRTTFSVNYIKSCIKKPLSIFIRLQVIFGMLIYPKVDFHLHQRNF
jgi:hypothetical protein